MLPLRAAGAEGHDYCFAGENEIQSTSLLQAPGFLKEQIVFSN